MDCWFANCYCKSNNLLLATVIIFSLAHAYVQERRRKGGLRKTHIIHCYCQSVSFSHHITSHHITHSLHVSHHTSSSRLNVPDDPGVIRNILESNPLPRVLLEELKDQVLSILGNSLWETEVDTGNPPVRSRVTLSLEGRVANQEFIH